MSHQRIRKFNTKGGTLLPDLELEFSRAVRAGAFVFLQGQTGFRFDGEFVGRGDPAAQAENAMQCVKILLEEAGARMEDICKITTYVQEYAHRALVYPVIARHLKGVYPVSTGVVVSGFGHPDIAFEIDVFAVIPEDRA